MSLRLGTTNPSAIRLGTTAVSKLMLGTAEVWSAAPAYDADAQVWFNAVVAAGSSITEDNKAAVSAFVAGCKTDGIWSAIKASCLLCAADSLAGALVPLVGTAPTNNGPFVSGDYSRTTGLVGDASTKYLTANRNNNTDPQNSKHLAVYTTSVPSGVTQTLLGCAGTTGASALRQVTTSHTIRNNSNALRTVAASLTAGFFGTSRSDSVNITVRVNGATNSYAEASATRLNAGIEVFRRGSEPSSARISFYSIGESIDLAKLDARLATLMAALT